MFRNDVALQASRIASMLEADLVGNNMSVRGFDKIKRSAYSEPVFTYALSVEFFERALRDPFISTICVSPKVFSDFSLSDYPNKSVILHPDPESAFFGLHNTLATNPQFYTQQDRPPVVGSDCEIHESAIIENGARIDRGVRIGAGVVVGAGVQLEEGVTVFSGATVGVDALELKRIDGQVRPVAHIGGVHIGRNVTIGANSVVSRALFNGETTIGAGSGIGEMVHVSHGVQIGTNSFLAGGVLTGGYSSIGDNSSIGIGARIKQFVSVGSDVSVSMGSVVVADVSDGMSVSGFYAKESRRWAAEQIRIGRTS